MALLHYSTMAPELRPIQKGTVMCGVEPCLYEATFLFTAAGAAIAAYCDSQAQEISNRFDVPLRPASERSVLSSQAG